MQCDGGACSDNRLASRVDLINRLIHATHSGSEQHCRSTLFLQLYLLLSIGNENLKF